jgi:hypothetical protein
MKALKFPLIAVASGFILVAASCQALRHYDWKTRQDTLALAARELRIGAPLSDMNAFMARHTDRFALDDTFHHVVAGFVPQTPLDKRLFDRKVQIDLYLDEDRHFRNADVNVYYTFL